METYDSVNLKGEVVITATDKAGNTEVLVDDRNLIVLNGRKLLAQSIIATSTASITDVTFGSGGTLPGNPSSAIPVSPSDTQVITPITGIVKGTDYSFITTDQSDTAATPRVVFSIVVPTDGTNLNNKSINELALMLNTTPTPSAFAIKRFGTISKSNVISLSISWTIFV